MSDPDLNVSPNCNGWWLCRQIPGHWVVDTLAILGSIFDYFIFGHICDPTLLL